MEQKDYIMREVEKFGLILRAMRQRLIGGGESFATRLENEVEEAKGMLLEQLNFDVDRFMEMDNEASIKYLSSFEGLNIENLETLALNFANLGSEEFQEEYVQKALLIYHHCNRKSQTFSFEREAKIAELNKTIEN